MQKKLILLACLSFPLVIQTAPPHLPSSRLAFAQIAQPTTATNAAITPQNLPCFKAFNGLSRIVYNTPSASGQFIAQVQQTNANPVTINTAFVSAEQSIVKIAQNATPNSFNN